MLYRRCDNSDGPVSDRKSRYVLGRPGKPVGAICVSLVPRQGRYPLYPPIRIEKFVPSLRSELNIPIGSAWFSGLQTSSFGFPVVDSGSTSHADCPSLSGGPLPGLTSPGETLRQRIDLVVVPARKRQQLRNERVQPRRVLGLVAPSRMATGPTLGVPRPAAQRPFPVR